MSPTELGGAIVIVLGAITGLVAATGTFSTERRKARSEARSESATGAAVLLASWKELGDSISADVERVKKSCAEEIAKLKAEHEHDRAEWRKERAELHRQITTLQEQVSQLMNRPAKTRTRIEDR